MSRNPLLNSSYGYLFSNCFQVDTEAEVKGNDFSEMGSQSFPIVDQINFVTIIYAESQQ